MGMLTCRAWSEELGVGLGHTCGVKGWTTWCTATTCSLRKCTQGEPGYQSPLPKLATRSPARSSRKLTKLVLTDRDLVNAGSFLVPEASFVQSPASQYRLAGQVWSVIVTQLKAEVQALLPVPACCV